MNLLLMGCCPRLWSLKAASAVLLLVLLGVPTLLAQPGIVDSNYLADVDGAVRSIALQPDGRLLISGQFRFVNGVERYGITRLNREGALDEQFQPAFDSGSASMILLQPDGRIIVGGSFQQAGAYLPQLIRLAADGALDPSFVPGSQQSFWKAFAYQSDGKILVAGDSGLVRLLPNGSLDTNFAGLSRFGNQTNEDGSISSAYLSFSSILVLPDEKILVGGNFDGVFGKPFSGLIRLNTDGTLDSTFRPATNWTAECLAALPDGTILSGGSTLYGPGAVRKFREDGQADPFFLTNVTFSGHISALAIQQDGKIIAAGNFDSVNGLPRGHIARLNPDGTSDLGFESSVGAQVDTLALQDDGAVLAGGWFDRHLLRILPGSSAFAGRFEFTSLVYQVNESGGNLVVPVCRYGGTNGTVTVDFKTFSGTATSGTDFIPQAGTLTFASGKTSNYFVVPILQDSVDEGCPNDERIGLSLSAPTGGATLGILNQAIISIVDDDCTLNFSQPTFTGLEASGRVAVTVVRSGFPNSTVTAVCGTTDLSALAGLDYVAADQVFTLAPGETNKTLWFTLLRDTLTEGDEQFALHMTQAQGANIGSRSNAVVRIVDDAPGSPDPGFIGQAGYSSTLAVLTGGEFFTLPFNIARCHADGTLDAEFHAPPDPIYYHRTLATEPKGTVVVARNSDDGLFRLNPDGSIDQTFSNALSRVLDVIRVQTDGKLVVGGFTYTQGLWRLKPDGTMDATFQPGVLANESIRAVLIQPDGKLLCSRIPQAGEGSQSSLVRLEPDGAFDPGFHADFSSADQIESLAIQTDGKILAGGRFSLGPGSYHYGLVRLEPNGSLDTGFSAAGSYGDPPPLAVQADNKILVGTLGAILRLNPDGSKDSTFDTGLGPSNGYSVNTVAAIGLQPDGGVLVSGRFTLMNGVTCAGIARLQNDDHSAAGEISLELRTPAVSESGDCVVAAVTRTGGSNGVVVVPFSTVDGSAQAGADYVPQSGVLTFADGDTSEKLITIPILPDTLPEGDETFRLNLGTPVGGAVWGKTASVTATIVDDDVTVQLAQNQYQAYERQRGLAVSLERLGQSAGEVWADYTTLDGSVLAGFDYIAQTGTVVFRPGETNKTILVPVIDDRLPESDETFTFTLTGVSAGARLGTNSAAVLTIVDDDHAGMPDPLFDPGPGLCEGTIYGPAELHCAALQADGRVLVGGDIISYSNGEFCAAVLQLLPDGSLDSAFALVPSVGIGLPVVRQIRVQPDDRVLLAVHLGSVADKCLRLLTNGLPDPSFAPVQLNPLYGVPGTAGSLETLMVQEDGKILIAGSFTSVNDVARYNLARLNSDGTLDLSFVPPQSRSPYAASIAREFISCLALEPNGRVLVGGNFIVTNSVQCYGLARLKSDGSPDLSFDPGTGVANQSGVAQPWSGLALQAIAVQPDGRILVGGTFMQANGNARTNLARLNSDGSVDLAFNPSFGWGDMPTLARVWTIVLQPDNKILLGGLFFDVNGQPRDGVARLHPDGTLDASFSAGTSQYSVRTIHALVLEPDGDILAAGSFYDVGGLRRCNIARLYGEPSLTPYQPWFTSLNRQRTGAIRLYFLAPPTRPYTVEATSDLIHWLGLGPAAEVMAGYFQLEDIKPAESNRFYRVLSQ